jgi:hypothetical protein
VACRDVPLELPIAAEAIGVVDLPDTWRVNLKNCFDWGGGGWYLKAIKDLSMYLTRSAQPRSGFYNTIFVYYNVVVM